MTENTAELLPILQDLDALWEPAAPASAERRFRELLARSERLTGRDRGYSIELLALIARAQAAQQNLPEARATLEEAERRLADPEAELRVATRIRCLVERGRLHIAEKTPSQARALFAEAWSLSENSGEDFFAVDIACLMASTESLKAQSDWISRGIRIAEGSPSARTKRWLGGLYASLGWKLYDLRRFEDSLQIFQKSLSHLKVHGGEREVFIAQWSIGKVLRALGRTEDALAIQKALLSELGIGGRRDGRLYEELAECLQTLNRTQEAQLYFELAYRELSNDDWVTDNQPVKLKRMKDLGKVK